MEQFHFSVRKRTADELYSHVAYYKGGTKILRLEATIEEGTCTSITPQVSVDGANWTDKEVLTITSAGTQIIQYSENYVRFKVLGADDLTLVIAGRALDRTGIDGALNSSGGKSEYTVYTADYGNDDTADGSFDLPFKNIQTAKEYLDELAGPDEVKTIYVLYTGGYNNQTRGIIFNTPNWHVEGINLVRNPESTSAKVSVYGHKRNANVSLLGPKIDTSFLMMVTNLTDESAKQWGDDTVTLNQGLVDIDTATETFDLVCAPLDNYEKVPSTPSSNVEYFNMYISFKNIQFSHYVESTSEFACPIIHLFGRDSGDYNYDYVAGRYVSYVNCGPTGINTTSQKQYAGLFVNSTNLIFENMNTADKILAFYNANELSFTGNNNRSPQDTPVYIYLSDDTTFGTCGTLPQSSFEIRGRLFGAHGPSEPLLFRDLLLFGEEVMINQYVDELKTFNYGKIGAYGVANIAADPRAGFEKIHRTRQVACREFENTGTGTLNTYVFTCQTFNKASTGDTQINELNVEGNAVISGGDVNIVRGGQVGGNLTIDSDAVADIANLTIRGDLILNGVDTTVEFNNVFVAGDIIVYAATTGTFTFNGGGYMGDILNELSIPVSPVNFIRNAAN